MLELNCPIIFFDTETTGIYPEYDRIIQIGLVKLYPDGTRTTYESLVNPEVEISKENAAIHGITTEMVKSAPKFHEIGEVLHKGFRGCDYGGYHVEFDVEMMRGEFNRMGLPDIMNGRFIDPCKIFQAYERRDLTAAVKHYLGRDITNAHSALPDAQHALEVFEAQLQRYPDLPTTVEQMHRQFFEYKKPGAIDQEGKFIWRNGEACLSFKFPGMPLREVPHDFLRWMLKKDFSEEVKGIVRKALMGVFPKKETDVV